MKENQQRENERQLIDRLVYSLRIGQRFARSRCRVSYHSEQYTRPRPPATGLAFILDRREYEIGRDRPDRAGSDSVDAT